MVGAVGSEERALAWFRRLVWIGIAGNVVLGLAGLLAPARVLALFRLEPTTILLWPRFAAFLLLLLTAFYVLAARDPLRHVEAAVLAVVCRIGGVLFFVVFGGGGYLVFALYDGVLAVTQGGALWAARRRLRAAWGDR
jgi:hypothetical protein